MDFVIRIDHRVQLIESKKYLDLARYLKRLWNMRVIMILLGNKTQLFPPFWGLRAELPTITWLLVMWFFKKWVLPIFCSGHLSKKNPFSFVSALREVCVQILLWEFCLHQENISVQPLLFSTSCSSEQQL